MNPPSKFASGDIKLQRKNSYLLVFNFTYKGDYVTECNGEVRSLKYTKKGVSRGK